MTDEYGRLHEEYTAAELRWRAAEIAAGAARRQFEIAARARKVEWDKLVAAADALPDEVRRKVADEQFGASTDHACPTCKKHVPSPCVARQNTVECPHLAMTSQESKCPHSTAGE